MSLQSNIIDPHFDSLMEELFRRHQRDYVRVRDALDDNQKRAYASLTTQIQRVLWMEQHLLSL